MPPKNGVGVPRGEDQLVADINAALEQMIEDGSWEEAVEANFGPANYDYEEAPTVGELPTE